MFLKLNFYVKSRTRSTGKTYLNRVYDNDSDISFDRNAIPGSLCGAEL